MKVLLINCVSANGGDAAIMLSAVKLLRAAFGDHLEVVVQDDHPQVARQRYPDLQFRTSCYWSLMYTQYEGRKGLWLARRQMLRFQLGAGLYRRGWDRLAKRLLSEEEVGYLREYQSSDLVVATGGTYLTPNYELSHRFFDMQTAKLFEKPLVLFTQTLGDIEDHRDRTNLRDVARYAKLVLLRDTASLRRLTNIAGESSRFIQSPDAAFAHAEHDLLRKSIDRKLLGSGSLKVAISVRHWAYFPDGNAQDGMQRYCQSIAKLCEHLVDKHAARITFVSTCQGVDSYNDDSELARQIVELIDHKIQSQIQVDREFHDPRELQELLAEYDFVISTRMHMAILALTVGAPVFPIAYEQKTNELFRDLGYSVSIPQIDTLTPETLIHDFESFLDFQQQSGENISERVLEYVDQVFEVVPLLKTSLPPIAEADAVAA